MARFRLGVRRSGDAGVVAIDGTKIAADASFFANRGREELAAEILEEAEAIDAAEEELLGDQRGGDLPDQWLAAKIVGIGSAPHWMSWIVRKRGTTSPGWLSEPARRRSWVAS